ncbi:MAG: DUF1559 domain-containing protein [Candidatus Omnitrophica bacterium]|nr:DUF1559 domain-containing protein [Candidatus Omnitrophota bacterium]
MTIERKIKSNGFVLIELLVVVMIVSILSSLILPALSKARERARQAVCMNNLKQIYIAFSMYTDDYEGFFPAYQDPFPEGYWLWMGRGWRILIGPYFVNINPYSYDKIKKRFSRPKDIFHCPSDKTAPTKWESTSYGYSMSFYHSPEQINQMDDKSYTYDKNKIFPTVGQKISQVAYPTKKIIIAEWLDNHTGGNNGWWSWEGSRNYLFVDGHVEFRKAKEILPANDGYPDINLTKNGILGKDIE